MASENFSLQSVAPGAILSHAHCRTNQSFKTKRFSKSAKNAHIADSDLCAALKEAMAGQVVDLGGGVYK